LAALGANGRYGVGDFYQSGVVATFHKMGKQGLQAIEAQLETYARDRPMALVLPSLYAELKGEALRRIVNELKEVRYIRDIVVTLGPASQREFTHAKEYFSVLPQRTRIIWNDGPVMTEVYSSIESRNLNTGEPGKGRSVWMAFGYVMSGPDVHAVVLHDSDIVGYERTLLARLCYPVANPNLDYDFCKGFYARVTDRMHGRVTRLLMTPLIRSLQKMLGHLPMLAFLDSFRYVLAGEFSMDASLARINRIPWDWGLEVGLLAEVYRNTALRRVCQVDISDSYEHKHQELSEKDPSRGLHKMAIDICESVLRALRSEGIVFPDRFFKTLAATYAKTAQDMMKRYEDDAAVNALEFDRHGEAQAIDTFTWAIREASDIVMADPVASPLIESWDRVTAAVPGILDQIRAAVDEDNK
jgi:glucosyl-3-phosphoglycerate synthase